MDIKKEPYFILGTQNIFQNPLFFTTFCSAENGLVLMYQISLIPLVTIHTLSQYLCL